MVNGAARSILPSEFLNWTVTDRVLAVGISSSYGCIVTGVIVAAVLTLLRVVALSIPPTVTVILFAAVLSSLTLVTAAVVLNGMVIVTVLVVPVPVIE
jgi:hypothetical protein